MEITKTINRHKFLVSPINLILKSFFYIIRKIIKIFVYEEGNIVIIALHKLGDTINTIPAVREIQKYYQKEIILFCYPESIPIYKLALNNVVFSQVQHKEFYFKDRIASRSARRKLKSSKPEVIIDITGVMTAASLIFNSRAKEIIGMNREQFKTIYDFYSPIRNKPHLIDIYLDAISSRIPITEREEIKKFPPQNCKEELILIHPFSGWKAKNWNFNKFINLAESLSFNNRVSLIIPKGFISEDTYDDLKGRNFEIVKTETINDLIEQIKLCWLFIGNDSGPLYIASLLGKSTFSIYGPTNSKFSIPQGEKHTSIKKNLKCLPDINWQYCFTNAGQSCCPTFQCMNMLTADEVFHNISQFINELLNK